MNIVRALAADALRSALLSCWSPHPENSTYWRKGTVVRLYDPEDHFGGLIIKMDEDGLEFRHRFVDKQWIRAVQGTDAKAADDNKPGDQAEANQTTPDTDKTGAVSCPASDDLKGTSQSAIFKRLVADRYERNGKSRDENEKNVSVSIHFDDFKTGATHPYRHIINNPDGPDGVDGGTVYAVKATYLGSAQKVSRTRFRLQTKKSAPTVGSGEPCRLGHRDAQYLNCRRRPDLTCPCLNVYPSMREVVS